MNNFIVYMQRLFPYFEKLISLYLPLYYNTKEAQIIFYDRGLFAEY